MDNYNDCNNPSQTSNHREVEYNEAKLPTHPDSAQYRREEIQLKKWKFLFCIDCKRFSNPGYSPARNIVNAYMNLNFLVAAFSLVKITLSYMDVITAILIKNWIWKILAFLTIIFYFFVLSILYKIFKLKWELYDDDVLISKTKQVGLFCNFFNGVETLKMVSATVYSVKLYNELNDERDLEYWMMCFGLVAWGVVCLLVYVSQIVMYYRSFKVAVEHLKEELMNKYLDVSVIGISEKDEKEEVR